MNDEEKDAALVRQQTLIAERSKALLEATTRMKSLEAENAELKADLGMYDQPILLIEGSDGDGQDVLRIHVQGGRLFIDSEGYISEEMRAVAFLQRFGAGLLKGALRNLETSTEEI